MKKVITDLMNHGYSKEHAQKLVGICIREYLKIPKADREKFESKFKEGGKDNATDNEAACD